MMKLRSLLLAGLLAIAPVAAGAQSGAQMGAQDWPAAKALHFVTTSAAGGATDIVPRLLSNHLSAAFGVPVVVENRPGAGGNIAAAVVARAKPDGHMLLSTGSNQAVNPTLLPNPGFDYGRDLVPVSMVVSAKILLVAAPAFAANTIADVIALAKQKPKSVSMAISPIGTPNHLTAEMLSQYGGIDLTFVPYDGIAQAIPDLVANRVDLGAASVATLLPFVRSGALKGLAVTSPPRSPLAPDIPTTAEAGLPELQIDGWLCFMTTGGTPAPVIARLDEEIGKVLALPEVHDALANQGIEVFHLDPAQLGAFLQSEAARFSSLLKHSRLTGGAQ
jgi:tripartite-type tricarboxylate transporter receptor subunit TctC